MYARSSQEPRRAFTLVELMVVIAIITLLVSILLPSLHRAREQSKVVVCRSNMRNIWTGILSYAFDSRDRVPFMEDINLNDPDADPFDPQYKTTVGVMMKDFIPQRSWKCPGAIAGFPRSANDGAWDITYSFSVAGPVGEGVPFDNTNWGTGGSLDPVVSNYVNFDGRPLRFLSGRRHTPSNPYAPNQDAIGPWTFSFPIVADRIEGDELNGTPRYPHKGVTERRLDLQNARSMFEANAGTGYLPARLEIQAHGEEEIAILLTRSPFPHEEGY